MELIREMGHWRDEQPPGWKMDEFIRKAKELKKENAKLKAQINNVRMGMEKFTRLIDLGYELDEYHTLDGDLIKLVIRDVVNTSGSIIAEGKDMSDLLDEITLLEE